MLLLCCLGYVDNCLTLNVNICAMKWEIKIQNPGAIRNLNFPNSNHKNIKHKTYVNIKKH